VFPFYSAKHGNWKAFIVDVKNLVEINFNCSFLLDSRVLSFSFCSSRYNFWHDIVIFWENPAISNTDVNSYVQLPGVSGEGTSSLKWNWLGPPCFFKAPK
jgi:hypothetical protein